VHTSQRPAGVDRRCVSRTRGGRAFIIAADLQDCEVVERSISDAVAHYGQIDAVINNAASALPARSVHEIHGDEWRAAFAGCLDPTFYVCRSVLPHFLARRRGCIVNVGSIAGCIAYPGLAAYGAAKAALSSLTRSIAAEYGPFGIRCNSVIPGVIDTPMASSVIAEGHRLHAAVHAIPLGRVGTPEEPAALIAFLCSAEAAYITGAEFVIDGGRLAW
jgi:NAD(P)-dependent dehydrogenase (short-subunit alcohol dehydrogenase family)